MRGRSPQAQRRPATGQPRAAVDYRDTTSRLSTPSSITSFPWRTLSQLAGVEATTKHHTRVRRVREETRARDEEADLDTDDTFSLPPNSSSSQKREGTWSAKKGNTSLSVRNSSKPQATAAAAAPPPPLPQPSRPHSRLASMRGRNDRDVAEREAAVELRKLRSAHKRAIIERAAQERSVPLTTTTATTKSLSANDTKRSASATLSGSSSQPRRKSPQQRGDIERDRDVRMMYFVLQGLHHVHVHSDNHGNEELRRREGTSSGVHPPRDDSVAAVGLYLMNTTMEGDDEHEDEAEYAGIRVDDGGYSSSDGTGATSAPASSSDEGEEKEKDDRVVEEEKEERRLNSSYGTHNTDAQRENKRSDEIKDKDKAITSVCTNTNRRGGGGDDDDEGPPLVRDERLHQLYHKLSFDQQVDTKKANENNSNGSSNCDGYDQNDEDATTEEKAQSSPRKTEEADDHDEPREETLSWEYGDEGHDELDVYRSMLEKFVHRSRNKGGDDYEEERNGRELGRNKKSAASNRSASQQEHATKSKEGTSSAKKRQPHSDQKRSVILLHNDNVVNDVIGGATANSLSFAPSTDNTSISNALFDTNAPSVCVALSSFRLHWRTAINSIESKKRAKIISEESKAFSSIVYYLYLGHDAIAARERSFSKWLEAVLIAEKAHRVKVIEEQKAHRKALKAYELSTRRRLISYLEKRIARKGDQSDAAVGRRREETLERIETAITLAAGEGNVEPPLFREGEKRGERVHVGADRKSVVSVAGSSSSKKQSDAQGTDSLSLHRGSVAVLDGLHSPQKLIIAARRSQSSATAATPLLSPLRRSTNSGASASTSSPFVPALEQQPLHRGNEETDEKKKIVSSDDDEVASRRRRQSSASGVNVTVRQRQQVAAIMGSASRRRPSSATGIVSNSQHTTNLKIRKSTIFEIKRASVAGGGEEEKKDPRGRSPSNLLLISATTNNVVLGGGEEQNTLGLSSRSRSVITGSSVAMEGGVGASSKIGRGQRPSSSSAMHLPNSTTSREQCQRDVRWAYEAKRLTDKLRLELLNLPQGQEEEEDRDNAYGEGGTKEASRNRQSEEERRNKSTQKGNIDNNKKKESVRDSVRRSGEAGQERATSKTTTPNNFSVIRARAERVYAERVKAVKKNNQHNENGSMNNQRNSSSRTRGDGLAKKAKVNAVMPTGNTMIESCVPAHTNFFMISLAAQQKGTDGEGCSPSVSPERLQQTQQSVSFMGRTSVSLGSERSGLSSPSNAFLNTSRRESATSSTAASSIRLSLTPPRATHPLPAASKQAPPPDEEEEEQQQLQGVRHATNLNLNDRRRQRIISKGH